MNLDTIRIDINEIDNQLKALFIQRMNLVKKVALYKKQHNLAIFDAKREAMIYERLLKDFDLELKEYYFAFIKCYIEESKKYQTNILK